MAWSNRRRPCRTLAVRLPVAAGAWLPFVRLLDGRPVAEWARGVLLEALGRLLVERPGWAWARPGSPVWGDPGPAGVLAPGAAPRAGLAGGERVAVLALLPGCLPGDLDPEGSGVGALVDVLPAEGEAGALLRRVLVRAVDVLPWRPGSGAWKALRLPVPPGAPGLAALEVRQLDGRPKVGGQVAAEHRRARAGARAEPAAPVPGAEPPAVSPGDV